MSKKLLLSVLVLSLIGCGILAYGSVLAVSTIFPNAYQITSTGDAINPDADIDASGNVYVAFEKSGSIYYKKNLESEQLIGTGTNPDIAVDSAGIAHIAYLDSGNVMYAKLGTAPDGVASGDYATIDTDSSNNAHIAYSSANSIYYSVSGAAGTLVLEAKNEGGIDKKYSNPVIKIDGSGNYHIACLYSAYVGDPLTDAKYIKVITNAADGNSLSANLGYDTNGILSQNGLAVDGSGAYIAFTGYDMKAYRAIVTTTDSWDEVIAVAGGASNAGIFVNGSTVGISYVSSGNVKFKEDTGSGFGSANTIDSGSNPVLVLGAGKYAYYEKSGNIYLATDQIITDSNPPVVSGVTEGGVYTVPTVITFTDAETTPTATLDGTAFVSGTTVNTLGAHTLIVTDIANTVTIHFTISDTTPPVVTGVTDGTTYTAAINGITFSDNFGTPTADLQGPAATSPVAHPVSPFNVSALGSYTLTVTDSVNNKTIINFTITTPSSGGGGGGGGGGGVSYFIITATAGANGSITPSGSTTVASGNNQTYAISANTGYKVASVLVDGTSVGAVTTYTFSNVTGSHTISATFADINAVVTKVGDINGDGKVDEYDFSIMMSQWGQTGTNLSADLNKDGKVDEYDFSLLMANWGV